MENKINVTSDSIWETKVGYSRAVRINNIVEVSGTTAVENDKVVGQGNIYEQTLFILERIGKALQEAGSSLEHVIRTRMYVTDINLWEDAGRAHEEVFRNIKPATTLVEVPGLIRPDLLIEIEATAVVPDK